MKKFTKIIIAVLAIAAICFALFESNNYTIDPQEAAVQEEMQKRRLSGC